MDRHLDNTKEELLVLAKRFHEFCVENNISYSIHGGTMLGAVREHGFIPWDDDIDITFVRNEYEKFERAIGNKPLNEIKLNKNGLYPRLVMWRKSQPVVWMDIFIYDYITDNPILRKYKITRLKLFNLMYRDQDTLKFTKRNSKGNTLRYLAIVALVKYGNKADKDKLFKRASKCMKSFPGKRNWLCRTNDTIVGMPKIVPGYAMNKYELIQFEDTELMISSYWHEILVVSYGYDYMTPRVTTDEETHDAFMEREIKKEEEEFMRIV